MKVPKQGERVSFVDSTEGAGDISHGIVNGEPFKHEGAVYIPVWVDSRPGGREGTTIYVDRRNLR